MVFVCELMAPVDPFLKGFFPTSKQPTTRDVFQQLRRCCLCPGPYSHTLHGTSCWNRARRSAGFCRWVNSPGRSIGNCQLGDSLYKDIFLITYNACTMFIVHVKSFIQTDPGYSLKCCHLFMLVNLLYIRDIYPDSHQKKFTTGFHSTVVSNQRKSNETTGPASLLGTPSASTFGRKLEFETSKVGSNDGSGHVYVWRDEGILVILQICVDDLVFVLWKKRVFLVHLH